jgi:tetratricopeptide (TPR) repeat protein
MCLGLSMLMLAPGVGSRPAAAQAAQPSAAHTARLQDALRTLARSPQSAEALIAAGDASLKLDNDDAALGFYRRAQAVAPQDLRVKAGVAAVMARQAQPLEALRLFFEAEQAGLALGPYFADRGLAYDLIGDTTRAQADYVQALRLGGDPTVSRRLALSQAIAGDQRASEATLLPLLQRSDLAAYRTRAFALAILGKSAEAVSIAETMLPARLSSRMAPYLRYMPRLTRAQQAAAANLGSFPRAGDIGRDDPAITAYAGPTAGAPTVRTADARLMPSGAPLGSAPRPAIAAVAPPPAASVANAAPVAIVAAPRVATPPAAAPAPSSSLAAATPRPAVSQPAAPAVTIPSPASTPQRVFAERPVTQQAVASVAQPTPAPVVVATLAPPQTAPQAMAAGPPAPIVVSTPAQPQTTLASVSQAQVAPAASTPAPAAVTPVVSAPQSPAPAPARAPVNLSDAFAEFRTAAPAARAAPGAVDITAIQPRREQAAVAAARTAPTPRPAAPPKPPPVPSRQWVQVATGRDTAALGFDWRRVKREAGGLLDRATPSTAVWGQSNRLVAGPFPTAAAADELIAKLKDKKIDAFRFTSAAGEEVKPLR